MPQIYELNEQGAPRLPLYRSHKVLRAGRIGSVTGIRDSRDMLLDLFDDNDERVGRFVVKESFVDKHRPLPGGYLVQFEDGYCTYMSSKSFDGNHTRVREED